MLLSWLVCWWLLEAMQGSSNAMRHCIRIKEAAGPALTALHDGLAITALHWNIAPLAAQADVGLNRVHDTGGATPGCAGWDLSRAADSGLQQHAAIAASWGSCEGAAGSKCHQHSSKHVASCNHLDV